MRSLYHPQPEDLDLSKVLYALSDPVRLSVVRQIAELGARPCGSFGLSVAKSTASHHFRVLRESGIIRVQPEGTQYFTSLRLDDLESRFPGLMTAVLNASDAT